MKILNPGKFEITIDGETKTVIISLGLKTELYKLITLAQMEIASLSKRMFINEDLAALIQEKDTAIKDMEAAEEAEEVVAKAKEDLDSLYGEALADLETRQHEALNSAILEKIELSEKVFMDAISCLLSERDEKGKIVNKLEVDTLMWSPKYAEAQEELTELLHAVTEYITLALKKISEISQMVHETTKAADPNQTS